jgi:uncharacterized protein YbjT (DUF2867 family)
LVERGHEVKALARQGSEGKLPAGVKQVSGNPLDGSTFRQAVGGADTFVHLVGVSKPAPWKEREFRAVDLESVKQSVGAAVAARVGHFVYVSVAQPAPVMKAYIRIRQECETLIRESGIPATFVRPWYVLGPGRRWPLMLVPVYGLMEALGSETARRLGLVTVGEIVTTLVWAVEHPGARILEVPAIRRIGAGLE